MVRSILLVASMLLSASFSAYAIQTGDFNKFFKPSGSISLDISDTEIEFIVSTGLASVHEDAIIYFDPASKKFFEFDITGKYTRSYGNEGRGPGEYSGMEVLRFYRDSLLYLYDSGNKKFINYSSQIETDEFVIKERVVDFGIADNGNILAYHFNPDLPHLLSLFNKEGELLKTTYSPSDQRLKSFIFPFRFGAIEYHPESNTFYLFHPEESVLRIYNDAAEQTGSITLSPEGQLAICCKPLPENIDPFDGGSDEAQEFLSTVPMVLDIKFIGNERILISYNLNSGPGEYEVFYSVFNMEGNPLIEDIKKPEGLRIIGTHSSGVYMSDQEHILKYNQMAFQ